MLFTTEYPNIYILSMIKWDHRYWKFSAFVYSCNDETDFKWRVIIINVLNTFKDLENQFLAIFQRTLELFRLTFRFIAKIVVASCNAYIPSWCKTAARNAKRTRVNSFYFNLYGVFLFIFKFISSSLDLPAAYDSLNHWINNCIAF